MKQPTEEQITEIQTCKQSASPRDGLPMRMSLDYDEVLRIAWQYLVDTGAAWNSKDGSVVLLNPSSTKGSSRVAITESMR